MNWFPAVFIWVIGSVYLALCLVSAAKRGDEEMKNLKRRLQNVEVKA